MGLLSLFKRSIKEGDKAPDFELPSKIGEKVRLADFLGKKAVVLYFYPKDDTHYCIAESIGFRDQYEVFTKAGAEVIGVSSDNQNSHLEFSKKYQLPFHLLSDTDNRVRRLYHVPKALGVIPGRTTFVIDSKGIIRLRFTSHFNADSHIELSLRKIQELQAKP